MNEAPLLFAAEDYAAIQRASAVLHSKENDPAYGGLLQTVAGSVDLVLRMAQVGETGVDSADIAPIIYESNPYLTEGDSSESTGVWGAGSPPPPPPLPGTRFMPSQPVHTPKPVERVDE